MIEPELMSINVDNAARHITADKVRPCAYCGNPIPKEAVGNPLWMHTARTGRQVAIFCSAACREWYAYDLARMKLTGIMEHKHASPDEIAARLQQLEADWKTRGTYPHSPKPERKQRDDRVLLQIPPRQKNKQAMAPDERPVVIEAHVDPDKYDKEDKPVESVETVQTPQPEPIPEPKPEPIPEPQPEPIIKPIPEKLLKRTIGRIDLKGKHINAHVYQDDDGSHRLLLFQISDDQVEPRMIRELRELADALEDVYTTAEVEGV